MVFISIPQTYHKQRKRKASKEAYNKGEATKEEYTDRCLTIDSEMSCVWEEYKLRVAEMCGYNIERCAVILEEKAW